MNRLLYEYSVSYRGHLIIPFVYGKVAEETVYSYKLLSELGRKGKFHKQGNPAGMYSNSTRGIVEIAQEHLDRYSDLHNWTNYFKNRYTYRNNLIIVLEQAGKYFYDHYPPHNLNNIAAPKIFRSYHDCLGWIKQGLDRNRSDPTHGRS